jgi:hypothetical protein
MKTAAIGCRGCNSLFSGAPTFLSAWRGRMRRSRHECRRSFRPSCQPWKTRPPAMKRGHRDDGQGGVALAAGVSFISQRANGSKQLTWSLLAKEKTRGSQPNMCIRRQCSCTRRPEARSERDNILRGRVLYCRITRIAPTSPKWGNSLFKYQGRLKLPSLAQLCEVRDS